jgi:hypothetical protein
MIQLSTIGWALIGITWIIGFVAILGCMYLYKQVRLHSFIGATIMCHLHKRNRSYTQLVTLLENLYGVPVDEVMRSLGETPANPSSDLNVKEMRYPDDHNSNGGSNNAT